MKYFFCILCLGLALVACRRKNDTLKTELYPINAILHENATKVDSAFGNAGYMRVLIIDSVTVSDKVDKNYFNNFVKSFFEIDLTNKKFSDMYKENSFQDASNGANGSASFSYFAIDKNAPYSMMQIAMDRGTQNYTHAYFKKSFKKQDSSVDRHLGWYFNRNATITDVYFLQGKQVKKVVEKLIWQQTPLDTTNTSTTPPATITLDAPKAN
jgi:hypothetical protein